MSAFSSCPMFHKRIADKIEHMYVQPLCTKHLILLKWSPPSLELTNGAVQNQTRTLSTAGSARFDCCPTPLAQFYISTVFNHCQRMHGLKLDAPTRPKPQPLPLPHYGPLRTQEFALGNNNVKRVARALHCNSWLTNWKSPIRKSTRCISIFSIIQIQNINNETITESRPLANCVLELTLPDIYGTQICIIIVGGALEPKQPFLPLIWAPTSRPS